MIHASAITICDASTFASPIAWWIHSSISSLIQNNRKSMTNCESRQLYTLSNSQNSSQNTQKHCGLGAPHYRPLCSTSPVSLLPFAAVAVLSATTVISLHSLAVPQRSHGLDEDLTLCERRVTLLRGGFFWIGGICTCGICTFAIMFFNAENATGKWIKQHPWSLAFGKQLLERPGPMWQPFVCLVDGLSWAFAQLRMLWRHDNDTWNCCFLKQKRVVWTGESLKSLRNIFADLHGSHCICCKLSIYTLFIF